MVLSVVFDVADQPHGSASLMQQTSSHLCPLGSVRMCRRPCDWLAPGHVRIKEWVDQMQKELISLADKATAGRSLTQVQTLTLSLNVLLGCSVMVKAQIWTTTVTAHSLFTKVQASL
ncbi:hypothetical protein WMY93_024140 [Mugilogobius chulae]|uniref:Uncharacterized protein n=1 Tax=Mugilogobius chulae TaxID=88201 RepID=A0AAW0NC02_9GOBI